MKQTMKLIIDDKPVHEARMANAKKKHDRVLLLDLWADCGKVRLLDENQHVVRVLVGDQIFEDRRNEYPSEGLIARVQLALHAGLTCQNITASELDRRWGKLVEKAFLGDTHIGEVLEVPATTWAKITAAVKKPWRPRP